MFKYHENTQSIAKLFSDSLQLYKQSLSKVLPWSFVFAFIVQIFTYLNNHSQHFTETALNKSLLTDLLQAYTLIPLILLPIFLTPAFSIIMIGYMQTTAMQTNQPPSLIHLQRQFYWRVLGADFLCWLVMFIGTALLIAITLLLTHNTYDTALSSIIGIVFLLLDCIILLIAMVVLYPYLAFYKPFIIVENLSIIPAIKASFKLAHNNWWRTATVLGIASIFVMLINMIVIWVFLDNNVAILIISTLVEALFAPIPIAFMLVLFNDLKLRKGTLHHISS